MNSKEKEWKRKKKLEKEMNKKDRNYQMKKE